MSKANDHNPIFLRFDGLIDMPAGGQVREEIRHDSKLIRRRIKDSNLVERTHNLEETWPDGLGRLDVCSLPDKPSWEYCHGLTPAVSHSDEGNIKSQAPAVYISITSFGSVDSPLVSMEGD